VTDFGTCNWDAFTLEDLFQFAPHIRTVLALAPATPGGLRPGPYDTNPF
jgi:hypothetical protein